MKKLLLLSLLFITGTIYSQKDSSQTIMVSKIKLVEFKTLNELVKDIPKDCHAIKVAIMHNGKKGKVMILKGEGLDLDEKMLYYFKHAAIHEKFIVDIHAECAVSFVKVTSFKVTD